MIYLPEGLTPTKYPGYFWHLGDQKLYSIKVGGVLHEMTLTYPGRYNRLDFPVYRVSHKGKRKLLFLHELRKLRITDHEIPYES